MADDRFYSTRFFSAEHNQWIVAIHDAEKEKCVFMADNFEIAPGVVAKDATPEQLGHYAFLASGGKAN